MFSTLQKIIQYRDLLFMLTQRDIRVRYKQAAMGFVWAIFMPVVAVLAGILIKKAMSVVTGTPVDMQSVVSISLKVLPWTFFVNGIKFAVQSLVGNSTLVTKIYFPRAVLPLAAILACFFDLLVALLVLAVLLVVFKVGVSVYLLWVPLLLIALFIFTAGLGLFLAAANLFYRDVKYIVEIILMFGIFFTPVFYSAASFKDWGVYILLNPVSSILEALNASVVLKQMPDLFWTAYALAGSVAMFWLGVLVFRKKEPYFVDNI